MSEAATITYVRHHTDIPAPKVSASDLINKNEVGFEQMIQDYVPGQNLAEAWKDMSWLRVNLLCAKSSATLRSFSKIGLLAWTTCMQPRASRSFPRPSLKMQNYLEPSTIPTRMHSAKSALSLCLSSGAIICNATPPAISSPTVVTGSLHRFNYIFSTSIDIGISPFKCSFI